MHTMIDPSTLPCASALRWSAAPTVVVMALLTAFTPAPAADTPDPTQLAEPHWPLGWHLPPPLGPEERKPKDTNADITIWLPPDTDRIRAVVLVPNNTDSKDWAQHGPLREILARHEVAILYMRRFGTGVEATPADYRDPPSDETRIPKLLRWAAEQTGIAEFAHAPWITFGKSSRGSFPFRLSWIYPERTIASIGYHAESPTWPPPEWAAFKDHSILRLNANGQTEWGGTWFQHVRPSLLNYNSRTPWLSHVMVAYKVGHGDYRTAPADATKRKRVWDYLSLFVDKALAVRLPAEGYPSQGPTPLRQVDPATGYLIEPHAVEDLFRVGHHALVKGEDGYTPADTGKPPVSGYAHIEPPRDLEIPAGVPVVTPDTAVQGFKDWLLTEQRTMQLKADPMTEPGTFKDLHPVPGDTVALDGKDFTFRRSEAGQIADEGGIRVRPERMTMLAYTVLEIPERRHYKVMAPFTPATRQQVFLAGVPLRHEQVVELEAGKYPLLLAVRMSVRWGRIGPWLEEVSAKQVALARELQAEADRRAAEQARIDAEGEADEPLIHPATTIPADKRGDYFWIPDLEMAEAWFAMHAVHEQEFTVSDPITNP